jgi:predicted RecB family nuclease
MPFICILMWLCEPPNCQRTISQFKALATYLGFSWRDTDPSGAASIEWFNRWIETDDTSIKQRILDYNEDDCRATRVLLDGIRALSMSNDVQG